jgi:hypothetical protein
VLRCLAKARGVSSTYGGSVARRALSSESYEMIKAEQKDRVGIIMLHRPKALNALCDHLISEVPTHNDHFIPNVLQDT